MLHGIPVSYNDVLVCPVCGFECVHPASVSVFNGERQGSAILINRKGIHLPEYNSEGARGAIIVLKFQCEEGHVFEHILKFIEGSILHATRHVNTEDSRDGNWIETFWRN